MPSIQNRFIGSIIGATKKVISMYTRFEKEAMEFILAGDNSVLNELRKQFHASSFSSREHDGYGIFLYFNIPVGIPKLTDLFDIKPRFTITDVNVRFSPDYHLYGMSLFIEDGYLLMLDGYPLEGVDWPVSFEEYRFVYSTDAERDMNTLESFWKK